MILNVSTLLFAVFLFLKAFARIGVLKKLVKTLLNSLIPVRGSVVAHGAV